MSQHLLGGICLGQPRRGLRLLLREALPRLRDVGSVSTGRFLLCRFDERKLLPKSGLDLTGCRQSRRVFGLEFGKACGRGALGRNSTLLCLPNRTLRFGDLLPQHVPDGRLPRKFSLILSLVFGDSSLGGVLLRGDTLFGAPQGGRRIGKTTIELISRISGGVEFGEERRLPFGKVASGRLGIGGATGARLVQLGQSIAEPLLGGLALPRDLRGTGRGLRLKSVDSVGECGRFEEPSLLRLMQRFVSVLELRFERAAPFGFLREAHRQLILSSSTAL
jgi:hypothetical protein